MKLTISEAARLYGIHRATLHRYLKSGRVSRAEFADGSPAVDFAELRRVLGEPVNAPEVRQPVTPPVASNATPPGDTLLLDEIRRQTAVIERMADRIERLELALLALPPPSASEAPKTDAHATIEPPADNEPPKTMADVLARFERR